jgi:methyl-accepting chemotaxis protein
VARQVARLFEALPDPPRVSQTTQQNASASEELSATAEEMNGQAEQLQHLVGQFRLDNALAAGTEHADVPRAQTGRAGTGKASAPRRLRYDAPQAPLGSAGAEPEYVRF